MGLYQSELRVRLARRETGVRPPVKYFYCPFQCGASFVDHLCYFCLVTGMLSCTSVGKGMTSWLSFVMSY